MNGKTLIITYTLSQLLREEFRGCHYPVEDLLKLRTVKQHSAIRRAMAKIEADTKPLGLPIEINWNGFADALGQQEFVDVIDRVAKIPGTVLVGKWYDFGDIGLTHILGTSSSLKRAFQRVRMIEFAMDPQNNTSMHIGKSRALNPRRYVLKMNGDNLLIEMNLNSQPENCARIGRVAQFFFCSSEAHNEEAQEIRRRADGMRRDEEDRRRNETQRAQEQNQRITQENQREQERYNKAMADYQKEMNERCNYSQCQSGYNKCGVCSGRGHNTNNNHTTECSSCKGQGKRPCQSCDGTMKKHPRGVSQPSQPRFRDQISMPTFGSMPDYESMI